MEGSDIDSYTYLIQEMTLVLVLNVISTATSTRVHDPSEARRDQNWEERKWQ